MNIVMNNFIDGTIKANKSFIFTGKKVKSKFFFVLSWNIICSNKDFAFITLGNNLYSVFISI